MFYKTQNSFTWHKDIQKKNLLEFNGILSRSHLSKQVFSQINEILQSYRCLHEGGLILVLCGFFKEHLAIKVIKTSTLSCLYTSICFKMYDQFLML